MPLTLAIIGRPNVGKSSIFNRLVGRRIAIVHDTPGVTRDRRVGDAVFHGLELRIIDTAGFEDAAPGSISSRTLKRAPWPGAVCRSTVPPGASAMAATIDSPSPAVPSP